MRAAYVLIAIGLSLLGIDLGGLSASYSAPAGLWRPASSHTRGRLARAQLSKRPGEADDAYFSRLASEVHNGMGYYWSDKADRVAVGDNWLLYAAGYVSHTYRMYEFTEADRALARGYGICSQYSNIVVDVLDDEGYSPRNVLYLDHTFVAVRSRVGRGYLVDPTFGVTIPESLEAVRSRPSSVKPYYARVRANDSPNGRGGAALGGEIAHVLSGAPMAVNRGSVTPHTAIVEPIAYVLKWAIPIAGLALGGCLVVLRRRRRAR